MRRSGWLTCSILLVGHVVGPSLAAWGQNSSVGSVAVDPRAASDWPLERVVLRDGRSFQGLVDAERAGSIEFVEVRRSPGKPMSLVVRSIERKAIADWERLSSTDAQQLRRRLADHKQRALIEARRMEDLSLSAGRLNGNLAWYYDGEWFSLASTTSEMTARRIIARLEQIFCAYRQILPPRTMREARLHVQVFGEGRLYRQALAEQKLSVTNPAVYLPAKRMILCGSELNRFDMELGAINRQHRQARQELDRDLAEMPQRLKALGDELAQAGVDESDRQKILVAEQRKWDDQRSLARRQLATLDRKNATRFDELSSRMFARLAHEAFHAYLDNFVFATREFDFPAWLNEGLAQVFEAGLLEGEALRVDSVHPGALAALQTDLRGDQPLSLAQLLGANNSQFLSTSHLAAQAATQAYAYAWGLAYYLAFESPALSGASFEQYLSSASAAAPPVERFEALIGGPLPEFESRWRAAMLALPNAP